MQQFSGRVALVTGATSGIGSAVARALAAEGASVIIAGRREQRGHALADALKAEGYQASFVTTDVRSVDSVVNMVAHAVKLYGRLDCAVNNAGISGVNALTADYPEEDWDEVMRVNLKGVWLCMKHEIPHLLQHRGSTIVNVSSDLGQVGAGIGVGAYVASKHGVIGITRAAAMEYAGSGLRINAVCPSFTETEMLGAALADDAEKARTFILNHVPMQRMASPDEIARAILWLCGDHSSFVTGHALAVDGGVLAR